MCEPAIFVDSADYISNVEQCVNQPCMKSTISPVENMLLQHLCVCQLHYAQMLHQDARLHNSMLYQASEPYRPDRLRCGCLATWLPKAHLRIPA